MIAEGAPPVLPAGLAERDGYPDHAVGLALVSDPAPIAVPSRIGPLAGSRGRHAAPPAPGESHGKRFSIFSAIGGVVFILGLALQIVLTGRLHVPALASYLVQAVVSVEVSFILNRWLTWRDRDTGLWTAFTRFNIQKAVTIALNFVLYAGLLHLGMNYLVANIVLTIVFTVVNYAAGDKLVFSPRKARTEELAVAEPRTIPFPAIQIGGPPVSVVIPCRNNESTIGATVQSLLDQDYPSLAEIIIIGSPDDTTWDGLTGIDDERLVLLERSAPAGVRDANFKRDIGVKMAKCKLVALIDSDIVVPDDWMSSAVSALQESGVSCVAGGMKSIHDSFWGRYTDNTVIGAKTPRVASSYLVNSKNFGTKGRKPPITANTLFTRELYERCAIDPTWSHGSYEDYEWFWRVSQAGYSILVCRDLYGWHHHRRGMRALIKEYRRSARGCAYFVRAHLDCPLAQRRRRQAVVVPVAAIAGTAALILAAAAGQSKTVAALVLGCVGLLTAQQILRLRRLEAVAYPLVGLALGLVFTTNLVNHLVRSGQASAVAPAGAIGERSAGSGADRAADATSHLGDRIRPRLQFPLLAICAVQAALSLTLVWSNTAIGGEAQYLWIGRLVWSHWLHGTTLPPVAGRLSGSPYLYPPIGALASHFGGVAGARLLSLAFMLAATVLLYLAANRVIGRTGALYAAGLWAITEPVLRLAFATYDPLSVLFTALAAWLIVQAGFRRRRGELVAAAALALALANATAFSGIVIDPVVLAFGFLTWRTRMTTAQAATVTGWFAAAFAAFLGVVMTATGSWAATTSIFARTSPDHQPVLLVVTDVWQYSGLVIIAAIIGLAAAAGSPDKRRAALIASLGLSAFLVPVAQLAEQTGWSLDKHLAYGIWFAAMAGGYAASTLISWLPDGRRWAAVACCTAAVLYLAANSWQSAWNIFHSWPDASSLVAALRPAVTGSSGLIDVPGQEYIGQYYLPEGRQWERWQTQAISLQPPMKPKVWPAYYDTQLASGNYGVFALFYAAPSDIAAQQAEASLQAGHLSAAYGTLRHLSPLATGEPGLDDLTAALEQAKKYKLVAVGSYDTSTLAGNHDYGVYAIWRQQASG